MTQNDKAESVRDSELIAFLDGNVQPAEGAALQARIASDAKLKARLSMLARGSRPFKEAFDAVLDSAPKARLATRLDAELRRHEAVGRRAQGKRRAALAAVAAGLTLLVIGIGAGYSLRFAGKPFSRPEIAQEADILDAWLQIVASNHALYTRDSLAVIGPDATPSDGDLEAIGTRLGVDLSKARGALSGGDLKEARLLEFHGVPFVRLVYLDADYGPVAFCIFAGDQDDERLEKSVREGMNLVYWVGEGLGFMLIGRVPMPDLETLAQTLTRQFPRIPA